MQAQIKRYTLSIRNHIQGVGYRRYVRDKARECGVKGVVWNLSDGSVKVLCEGTEEAVSTFIEGIKKWRERQLSVDVVEGVQLPEFAIAVTEYPLVEIYENLAKGVGILEGIKGDTSVLGSMDGKLGSMDDRLGSVDGKLGGIHGELGDIRGKLGSVDGKLGSMDDRLGSVDGKLGGIHGELGDIRGKLGSVDGKLGSMDDRLGSVDGKLGGIHGELGDIRDDTSRLGSIDEKMDVLGEKLDALPEKIGEKLDTLPERIAEVLKK
jgi:acylphosphatase/archaellum component FlaC